MRALTTAAASPRGSDSFWRSVALALGRGVAAGVLVLGGSHAALATFAAAPTVQCTGQCQGCMEMESTPDGKGRCTKCGVLPTCLGNDGGMYDAATNLLNAQNDLRARHGSPPLTWSPDLAKSAQKWANLCTPDPKDPTRFAHSVSEGAFSKYGENLYWTGKTGDSGALDAVTWWYNEINNYNFNDPISSYKIAEKNDGSPEVRHFTQLIWKDTTQLGCAMNQCGTRQLWVCQYGPPGNFNGDNPGVLENEVGRLRSVSRSSAFRPKVPSILGPASRYRLPSYVRQAPIAPQVVPPLARYAARPADQPPLATRYPNPLPAPRPPLVTYYPNHLPAPRPPLVTHYPNHLPAPRPPLVTHYPNHLPTPRPPSVTHYPNHLPTPRPPSVTHYPNHLPAPRPPLVTRYPGLAPGARLAALRANPSVRYLRQAQQHSTHAMRAPVRRYRRH